MNLLEKQMLDLLKKGRQQYGYLGIKCEFEAEGTRKDELIRLMEIVRKADLKVGIKIGGCEALTDLYTCRLFGVDYIISPMIESPYALSKYIEAKNAVFNNDEREEIKFLFNLETNTAFNSLSEIINTAKLEDGADGIVFGRVDFSKSLAFTGYGNSIRELDQYCMTVAHSCREHGLEYVVGGSVNKELVDSLKKIKKVYLDRFETRKIIFDADILSGDIFPNLRSAIEFEVLYLKNKSLYYGTISREDSNRIKMLEERVSHFQTKSTSLWQ